MLAFAIPTSSQVSFWKPEPGPNKQELSKSQNNTYSNRESLVSLGGY